jgi:hypothetical protein
MKRRVVEWVRRRPGFAATSHQAIVQLGGSGGDGKPWSLSANELIHDLRNASDIYYVGVGGRRLVIDVCQGPADPFLRCWDKDHWTNDLAQLPERDSGGRR